jgi:NADH dehydrogenase
MQLVVIGGNGFIGREVCRQAVAAGHEVTSVARSGPPDPPQRGPWANSVDWRAADVFAPQDWRDVLRDADSVIHSIGIIEEAPTEGVTFERVNGDAAIIAALESERAGVDRFVYLSSSATPPGVREAYIAAKRRAEKAIDGLDIETAILRPGPVYGPDQPHFSAPVNAFFELLGRFDVVASQFGANRPLSVETVGRVAFDAAVREHPPDGPMGGPVIAAEYR